MRRRLTNEDYINRCKVKGFDLSIEPYINMKTKIKHKCKQGHIYEQIPSKHLQGQGCPSCSEYHVMIKKRKIPKQYYNECKEKGLDLPVEDYINNKTKIKHKCNKCGNIYGQTPSNHLQGQGCPKCGIKKAINSRTGKTKKKTPEEYYNECKSKGYDLPIENYVKDNTKIKHRCNKGHIYKQIPSDHLQGRGCPICYGKKKKTSEEYYQECKSKGLDLPIEDYKGAKIKIKHTCGKEHLYLQTPDMHSGKHQGCPICNESHGEKYTRNYLDKNNIKYIPQKRFHDLKDKTYLSYDFCLPDYNILIEYQGIQHYDISEYFGGKEQFNRQKLHDNLKRKYAKENGYKLLELKYTLNTQELVDRYLNRRIK